MRNLPMTYVPSGTFTISHGQDMLLVALLGTCVGVALYDREASVGGLIHILLPEPTGTTDVWQPENYATTGLPLFLKGLLEAGAQKDRIWAVVAGGSLFGPVSWGDLRLDFGGRTTERVFDILNQEQIPILKAETGGRFAMDLLLNTATWDTTIKQALDKGMDNNRNMPLPNSEEIDQAIAHTSPIPQIALSIMRMLRHENYSTEELAEEFKSDQVLVAKVLRLCNSAMLSADKRIDSIDHALVLLGEGHLLELIVSASVDVFFSQQEGGYSLMRGGLFKHALGVAHVAKVISQFTGRQDPGTAYTAGLIHDIGKVVLDHYVGRAIPLFYKNAPTDDSDLIHLEIEALGVDHQEIGKRLAKEWNLPESLTEVIAFHHWPEMAEKHGELVHLVYLADLLTSWVLAGLELEKINTESLHGRLQRLGLKPEQIPIIIDRVPWKKLMYA